MRENTVEQLASALEHGGALVYIRDHPVHVMCASGHRSSAMTDVLAATGFDAIDVAGGTSARVRSGLPTEK
jgi:rhodanese-related sulfurtransferase